MTLEKLTSAIGLSIEGNDATAYTPPPEGLPTTIKCKIGGVESEFPVSYWWKNVIASGDYVHPQTGQRLPVNAARIDGWVDKFNKMRGAGIDIHAPTRHSDDAKDNVGFVVKAERDGDKLRLLHQVIGEDGALMAARNLCSVKIDPNYIDEKGTNWGEAIVHSAFTPTPVITGMGPFIPAFAASRGQSNEIPEFHLSAPGVPIMDLKLLRTELGAAADVTDEKVIELATSRLTTLKSQNVELSRKATDAETKVVELSRTPAAPDPEILRDRAELTLGRIDLAVAAGDLPPFIAQKVKGWISDANGTPKPFMLSRQDGFNERPIDAILKLFEGAKLNPATGKVTTLLRQDPDGGASGKEQEADKLRKDTADRERESQKR